MVGNIKKQNKKKQKMSPRKILINVEIYLSNFF